MNRYILLSLLSMLICSVVTLHNKDGRIHTNVEEMIDPSFIVPDDGDLTEAFKAAREREDTAARFMIFIRKGEYYLKGDSGATIQVEGINYPSPITTLRSPNVTIIGEVGQCGSMEQTRTRRHRYYRYIVDSTRKPQYPDQESHH